MWVLCILTLPVCVSQGHKYVVQAEVLHKSWDLDESQLAFVHMLRDLEKNEMRGTNLRQSQTRHQTVRCTESPEGETGKKVAVFILPPLKKQSKLAFYVSANHRYVEC